MYGQGTALDEALVAIFYGAMIWPLIGVDAIMATEIGLAIERLFQIFSQTQIIESRKVGALTFPQCSHEQLKSRPLPGAMTAQSSRHLR